MIVTVFKLEYTSFEFDKIIFMQVVTVMLTDLAKVYLKAIANCNLKY